MSFTIDGKEIPFENWSIFVCGIDAVIKIDQKVEKISKKNTILTQKNFFE
jgi:hypothetical protein